MLAFFQPSFGMHGCPMSIPEKSIQTRKYYPPCGSCCRAFFLLFDKNFYVPNVPELQLASL
jgi:hypothetical protein